MSMLLAYELVSPERLLASGEASSLTLPASEGEMGVLPGHAPVLVMLQAGTVQVTMANGEAKSFAVAGGFADVSQSRVTILADGL